MCKLLSKKLKKINELLNGLIRIILELLKNYNIKVESDYYKNIDNFDCDFKFNVNSNDNTHYLHYGHMSIFSKKSNLDLYIKNLKFLIFKIKNNEEIHNKSFYIDESLEKKFIDTGKKFQ